MFALLNKIVDLLYIKPLRVIPKDTFRYAFAGGLNVAYGIVQYWFIYNFVLAKNDVDLNIVVISAPIMAFLINFVITFFTGFYLVREIAFGKKHKHPKGRQFALYAGVVTINLLVNYFGLKIMVEQLYFFPSISNALIQIVTIAISFTLNKFITFKQTK